MTNRISLGSTVPGIHPIPIPTASTSGPVGSPKKSPLATAGLWFSISPEALKRLQKTAAKNDLGKAAWKAMLLTNDYRLEIF